MRESADTIRRLQSIIDASAATAGPAIALNFIGGGWRMSAEELVAFWGELRMATVSTASPRGQVHAAPVEIRLIDGAFHIPTFGDSVRLRDHRRNPRCAITSWEDAYHAVIVYGDASVPGEGAPGLISVIVTPTRIYGIRPPTEDRRLTTDNPSL